VTATTRPRASWMGSTQWHTPRSTASRAHRKRDVAKLICSSRVSTAAGEWRYAAQVRGPRVHADTGVVHTEDAPLCLIVTIFSGLTALAREPESPTGQKNLPGELISTLCVTPHTQIILPGFTFFVLQPLTSEIQKKSVSTRDFFHKRLINVCQNISLGSSTSFFHNKFQKSVK
jgi:hypothetical protein